MKLKLAMEKDAAVLTVREDVNTQHVPVLRAGLVKILKSGHDNIILDVSATNQLPMEALVEIVKLQLTAKQLEGEIVLVGDPKPIGQAMQNLATAPFPLKHFNTVEEALKALRPVPPAPLIPPLAAPSALEGASTELTARIAKLEVENAALEAKIASQPVAEARRLRLENGSLRKQITSLEEQLRAFRKEQKAKFEMDSIQTKVAQLEQALEGFLLSEELLPPISERASN